MLHSLNAHSQKRKNYGLAVVYSKNIVHIAIVMTTQTFTYRFFYFIRFTGK